MTTSRNGEDAFTINVRNADDGNGKAQYGYAAEGMPDSSGKPGEDGRVGLVPYLQRIAGTGVPHRFIRG